MTKTEKTIEIVPSTNNVDKSKEAFGSLIEDIQLETNFSPLVRQILGSLGPIFITICGGMVSGYSAILLPKLKQADSPIQITTSEESWIAALAPLPMASACVLGGWAMEKFGRKKTNIYGCLLLLVGWAFIYFANSVGYILLGRLITGFSVGATGPASTCYIGEICCPKYRGFLLSMIALGVAIGLFITHLLGTYLSWETTALLMMVLPTVSVILIGFMPESHVWYTNKNDFKRAKKAFFWFRGYGQSSKDELQAIFDGQGKDRKKRSLSETLQECKKPQFWKPLLILGVFFTTVQFSGQNAVVFYSVDIMQATVKSMDKYSAMLIVDAIRVVVSVSACVLTKKFRVRPLTIISGLFTSLSLILLAALIYLSSIYPSNKTLTVLPLVTLIAYIVSISSGLAPLPWALCGELFAPATKGIGGGISTTINFLTFFAVVKTSPDMFEGFGSAVTFAIYGGFAFLGTAILYCVLPETKNKTLKDIEAYFTKETRVYEGEQLR